MDADSNGHDPDALAHRGAEFVEAAVSLVRDRAVRPVVNAARYLVLGVVGATLTLVVAILLVIGLVRVLDHDAFGGRTFITDLVFGGIFLLAGTFLIARGLRGRHETTEGEGEHD